MSAEAASLVSSWKVGHRTVTLTVPKLRPGAVAHAVFEWSPDLPQRLSRRDLREYRRGRDKAFAALGLPAAVVEV